MALPHSAQTQEGAAVGGEGCTGTSGKLIKSRQRVKSHGEVFTPRRMVNRMLDLVRAEFETGPQFVDKTFFEPGIMRKSGVSRDTEQAAA